MTDIDLGNISRITDRPGATPAPTAAGDDLPRPLFPSPWQPRTVQVSDCGCIDGDLCTHACDDTRDRIELAFAPQIRWWCSGGYWTAAA